MLEAWLTHVCIAARTQRTFSFLRSNIGQPCVARQRIFAGCWIVDTRSVLRWLWWAIVIGSSSVSDLPWRAVLAHSNSAIVDVLIESNRRRWRAANSGSMASIYLS